MTLTNKQAILSSIAFFGTLSIQACGSAPPPVVAEPEPVRPEPIVEAPPPPPPARLRVIHAASDATVHEVIFSIDGVPSSLPALPFKGTTPYADLEAGEHTLSIKNSDDPSEELVSATTPELENGVSYSMITYSLADFPIARTVLRDESSEADEGKAAVRFFHALTGLADIDVCTPGESPRAPATAIFAGVAPGSAGGDGAYAVVDAGAELVVQLRTKHATACQGRVQGVIRVTPTAGRRYTFVAVGRLVGRPRLPKEVLACVDSPGDPSCTPVAVAAR